MSRRPRIVMGAYACHPYLGSEPTVGWNRAVESSRFADVEVITHDEGNEEIVRATVRERGLQKHLRFHFLAHTPFETKLMSLPGGYYAGYRRWQHRAYRLAQEWHRRKPYDLAHQVNMCGYREPGELWKLGLPLVWGPIGGTQNTPPAFFAYGGAGMTAREGVRGALNEIQLRTSRRIRKAAHAADVVLAANSTGQRDFKRVLGIDAPRLLETGVRAVGEAKRWADRAPGPFRILWAGELVPRKGIQIILDAVQRLHATGGPEVELMVVGDGPEREAVEATPGATFYGWIPRAELLDLYTDADALAFTSLRDTSGNVMLEGLAAGLPVVYLNHQGAADMGTDACGVPVPVTTPEEAIAGVARGIERLATDSELYDRLSAGAIVRAEQLHWSVNGDRVNQIYADLLGHSSASGSSPKAPQSTRPVLAPQHHV